MKRNLRCTFGVLFSLLFSLSTFAQKDIIYRDTSSGFSSSSSGGSYNYKSIRVGNYQDKRFSEKKGIFETTFPTKNWDRTVVFPIDFQNGFDSLYKKDATQTDFVLQEVWTYLNKEGTAKWEVYYPNGQMQQSCNYIGEGLDTIITIDSTYEEPKYRADDPTKIEHYRVLPLEEKDWKRDSQYVYKALREGILQGWHEDGSIFYTQNFKNGLPHDTTIIYHKNGSISEIFTHQEGVMVGIREGWFENGKKRMEIYLDEKAPSYTNKEWYENGQLKGEAIKEGEFISILQWFESGHLKEMISFYRGDTLGDYKLYYPNGQIQMSGRYDTLEYKNDSLDLLIKVGEDYERIKGTIDSDSTMSYDFTPYEFNSFTFRNGQFKYWNKKGELLFEELYKLGKLADRKVHTNPKAVIDFYYPPAQMNCQIKINYSMPKDALRFSKSICTGSVEHMRIDTIKAEYKMPGTDTMAMFTDIITLKSRLGQCTYESYYPNGQIQMRLHFKEQPFGENKEIKIGWSYSRNGIPAGLWTYWYPNGNIKWEKNYLDVDYTTIPIVLDEKQYYENGQIKSEVHQVASPLEGYYNGVGTSDEGVHKEWFENGQLKVETHYFDGDREGDEKHWNKNGVLIKHLKYKKGDLFHWQRYYDDDGNLTKKEYYSNGKLKKIKEVKNKFHYRT
jgi:antitoxin component YwqK of YwqJK toxin-antitoxin module